MKREKDADLAATTAAPRGASLEAPPKVSIQAIYAEAMREVMADPRKAVAEHEPWLATILPPPPSTTGGNP